MKPEQHNNADYHLEPIASSDSEVLHDATTDAMNDYALDPIDNDQAAAMGLPRAEDSPSAQENESEIESSADGSIWFDGEVLACTCPDCGHLMSVRIWLMVADCWACSSSVELTEQQEEEARRLVERRRRRRATSQNEPSPSSAAATFVETKQPESQLPAASHLEIENPIENSNEKEEDDLDKPVLLGSLVGANRHVLAADVHRGVRRRVHDLYHRGELLMAFYTMMNNLPALIFSAVTIAVILLIMSMIYDTIAGAKNELITLSSSVDYTDIEGDFVDDVLPDVDVEVFEFDDSGDVETSTIEEEIMRVVEQAATPEVVADYIPPVEELGMIEPIPSAIVSETVPLDIEVQDERPPNHMYAGRNPLARARMVKTSGGTNETEAAVARALIFLSRHQREDGSWSLHDHHKTKDCDDTCKKGLGNKRSDMSATAMSLLPFLGAGQTHTQGNYQKEVRAGLEWILTNQGEDGSLLGKGGGNTGMYAHGQAAIVLCEAYALTGDPDLKGPAQQALYYIIHAQHGAGGWRYKPGEAGDTSVVGWQLMALQSGRHAGNLRVPVRTLDLAGKFLDSVERNNPKLYKDGSRYGYMPGQAASETMTAEGLLCRLYLGWPTTHDGIEGGVDYLLDEHMPDPEKANIYYWYYATQLMHHVGGQDWQEWNSKMSATLLKMQSKKGHSAGSWDPKGKFSNEGGRIYMTALATCILEVYYRHMPMNTSEVAPDANGAGGSLIRQPNR